MANDLYRNGAGIFAKQAGCNPSNELPMSRHDGIRCRFEDGAVQSQLMTYPVTPDGRYFVVRGRLWRTTNPNLPEETRRELTRQLMQARRAVGVAQRSQDQATLAQARTQVDAAKIALGERGPVWWDDGTPDYNRHLAKNTPYAQWHRNLPDQAP